MSEKNRVETVTVDGRPFALEWTAAGVISVSRADMGASDGVAVYRRNSNTWDDAGPHWLGTRMKAQLRREIRDV